MLLLLVCLAAAQVTLLQELDSVVVSANDTYTLNLYDYFQGQDLRFNISSSSPSVKAVDPFALRLAGYLRQSYEVQSYIMSPSRKLRQCIIDQKQFVISYFQDNIIFSTLSSNGPVVESTIQVSSQLENGEVADLAVTYDCTAVIVAIYGMRASQELLYTYLINIQNVYRPIQEKRLELVTTGVKRVRMEISRKYLVVIGVILAYGTDTHNSLSLYDITNIYSPLLLQNLVGTTIPSKDPFDLKFEDDDTFYLIDKSHGLYEFTIADSKLYCPRSVALDMIGAAQSLDIQNEIIVVAMATSTVIIDIATLTPQNIVRLRWNESQYSIQLVGDYAVSISKYSGSFIVNVFDLTLNVNSAIVRRWNLTEILDHDSDSFSPFIAIPASSSCINIMKSETIGLYLFEMEIGTWTLESFQTVDGTVAKVTSWSMNFPKLSVSSTLTLNLLDDNNGAIVTSHNHRPYKGVLTVNVEVFDKITNQIYFDLSSYFAGSYQHYSLLFEDSPYILLEYSMADKSVSSTSSLILSYDSTIQSAGNVVAVLQFLSKEINYFVFQDGDFQFIATIMLELYNNGNILTASNDQVVVMYSNMSYLLVLVNLPTNQLFNSISCINCSNLKIFETDLFCFNKKSVTVFTIYETYIDFTDLIDHTTVAFVDAFNIVDLTFYVLHGKRILYIVDKVLGLLSIDITNFDKTFEYNWQVFGDSKGVVSAYTSEDMLYFVKNDGQVDFYTLKYGRLPTLFKTVSGKGGLVRSSSTSSILALQYASFVDVIDVFEEAYSAFYTKLELPNDCPVLATDTEGVTTLIYKCPNSVSISWTTIIGSRPSRSSPMVYQVPIIITSQDVLFTRTTVKGFAVASNGNSTVSLPAFIKATIYGDEVLPSSFPIHNSTSVSYDQEVSTDLSSLFIGQNIRFKLHINGLQTIYEEGFNNDPAKIIPKISILKSLSIADEEVFYGLAVCQEFGITMATSKAGIHLYYNNRDHLISYASLMKADVLCSSVAYQLTQDTAHHFLAVCNYTVLEKSYISTLQFTQTSLYTLTIDISKGILEMSYTNVGNINFVPLAAMSFANLENNSTFDVIISQNYDQYTGEWTNSFVQMNSYFYTNPYTKPYSSSVATSFYNLNLSSLSVSAVDSLKTAEGRRYMYVADSLFGLRILDATLPLNLTQVYGLKSEVPFVSLGICNNFLFIGDIDEGVHKYWLKTPVTPVYLESYFKLGGMQGARGSIRCSPASEPQFAAIPLFDSDGFYTIRILDLYKDASYCIFAEISLLGSNITDFPGSFEFSSPSVLTVLSGNTITDYYIASPVLTYPAMSKDQYQGMLKKWNTNIFSLYISSNSGEAYLKTPQFYLHRQGPSQTDDDEAADFSRVLAVSFGVLLLI